MAGCTNGDRVDEVRVGHVGQVGHGAVLVSRVRSVGDDRVVYVRKKSFREKFQGKLSTLHFLLDFLHRDRAWVCAPKGTYYPVCLHVRNVACSLRGHRSWNPTQRSALHQLEAQCALR